MKSEPIPFISIITATYNSEKVFERFLLSVTGQTYTNFELIIIDGASKDKTLDIIKKYENSIIKSWISEKDSGVYDAWNKGLKLARGEWITFIGSDDILYPDAFQNYVDYLNNNTERHLNFLSSRIEIIDYNIRVIRELGWAWEWKAFKKMCNIAHPGALHHKSLFKTFGNFDTSYKICGDYDFLLRVGENLIAGYMNIITLQMSIGGLSDTRGLIKEVYRAVNKSGNVPKTQIYQQYIEQHIKYYLKKMLRKINVHIVLKK